MNEYQIKNNNFNLEERTAKFGQEIILFAKLIPENTITRPLINQLIKSGTSVGANYCEADEAESKRDFIHKIGLCKKEIKEVRHWLRMIIVAIPELKEKARQLWKEARELNLIFSAIIRSAKEKK